ncbi:aldo/keto reductase [Desulfosarcina sp.]|uniref:aldo/keto reductase n=1 Tax=Desulfosarcina sp. TaxID=2027861 RepID=UPI0035622082
MIDPNIKMTRRSFLGTVGTLTSVMLLPPRRLPAAENRFLLRPIPSSGERLPVMGMGTSRTFDVQGDAAAMEQLAQVLAAFFDNGGRLIDSSPMYGSAESVIGKLLGSKQGKSSLFAATKVWTDGRAAGIAQMERSMQRLGVDVIDLMQIHNLRDWKTHLPVLREWKQKGRIRYIGITTSHGRDHEALAQVLRTETLDFVQFSYNIADRAAEEQLLPLAADHGVAVLINRPFQRGSLFQKTRGRGLPAWSTEFDCNSWAQFFLKFIIAHPDVTCVIPATSKVKHMTDNMAAGVGSLPDADLRRRMVTHVASL